MAEIADADLELLRRSHKVLMDLNGDKGARPLLEQALKAKFPGVVTEAEAAERTIAPRLEALQADVIAPLAAELKILREEREANATRTVEGNLNDAFAEMRTKRGFTDEGIEAVKKLMVDNSIADPRAAAALWAEQNPVPSQEVPGWTPQGWNIEQNVTDYDLKGLFANEDAWGDNMAAKALNEIRVGQAA